MKWELPENQAVRFMAAAVSVALAGIVLGLLVWLLVAGYGVLATAFGPDAAQVAVGGGFVFIMFTFAAWDIFFR